MVLRHVRALVTIATAVASAAMAAASAPQVEATAQERVAAVKQSLQDGQTALRQYEWIETTIISLKGEEKARKQQRCYYGADGKLQKLPIDAATPQPAAPTSSRRGARLKQRIVDNKKDEMQDYMERAAGLVHQYVPPNPESIQRSTEAGKVTVGTPAPGHARLEFADYIKPGDRLAIEIDAVENRMLALSVASYLDSAEDAVTLDVEFGTLAGGTSYVAQTTLDARATDIRVVIQNVGHRPLGQ